MVRRWLGFCAVRAPLAAAALALVAVIGGPALVGGCTVVVSDGPLDGGAFTGFDATPGPSDNPCNACLFQQCSGSWAVCENSSECLAIYTCALRCNGDVACIDGCFCAHPSAQNAYVALAACDSYYACGTCQTACKTPASSCTAPGVIARDLCGAPPPPVDSGAGDAGTSVDAAPPADAGASVATDAAAVVTCGSCVDGRCSSEKQACAPRSECEGYMLCIGFCNDRQCIADCAAAHPTGQAASQALQTCTTTNCKDACGL